MRTRRAVTERKLTGRYRSLGINVAVTEITITPIGFPAPTGDTQNPHTEERIAACGLKKS